MRMTVIPAQITTVEDKIAGSLNLTQILILMAPVFWTTLVFAMFPPRLHLVLYKMPMILTVLIICLILSLKIKGKVVLNWLLVVVRYNLRARYYLFNKNDSYLRVMDMPELDKKSIKLFHKVRNKNKIRIKAISFGMNDFIKLKNFIHNPSYTLSLKPDERGGLYVALKQIKK